MGESSTRFWLLRHGLPEGGECFRGRVDLPLTAKGYASMGQALRRVGAVDRVLTSPLQRCALFAAEWASARGCPLETVPAIAELDFGRWDGRAIAEVWREESELVQKFWQNPYQGGPPEGERIDAFEARVGAQMQEWLQRFAGETLLVVSHGGVMRAWLKWALTLPVESKAHLEALALGYAGLIELEVFTDEHGQHWPRLCALYPAPEAIQEMSKEVGDE